MKKNLCGYKLKILSTMVVFTMSVIAQSAGAAPPPLDKGAFKKGCTAGGGSFVESASDNSFSCNLKSGGTIKCPESGDHPCNYSAHLTDRLVLQGLNLGKLKISPPSVRRQGSE